MMDRVLEQLLDIARGGGSGAIAGMQTSFVDVVWRASERTEARYRIHYRRKLDSSLERGAISTIEFTREHPLCLDFVERQNSLYIGTRPSEPEAVLQELEATVSQVFNGWRTLKRYLNRQFDAARLLREGHGQLLSGPESFVARTADVLKAHGVTTRVLKGVERAHEPTALLLDRNYVVAEEFRAEAFA